MSRSEMHQWLLCGPAVAPVNSKQPVLLEQTSAKPRPFADFSGSSECWASKSDNVFIHQVEPFGQGPQDGERQRIRPPADRPCATPSWAG